MAKTRKWKRRNYLFRKAIREAKKRLRSRRPSSRGLPHYLKHRVDRKGFYHISPPEDFSMINNPNDLLSYFQEAREVFRRGYNIFFSLEDIKTLTPDAIATLAAILSDQNFVRGKSHSGEAPRNPVLKEMLIKSGFYRFFHSVLSGFTFPEGTALRHVSEKQVDGVLAASICSEAVQHSLGGLERYKPIYEILIECMANTNNHADPKSISIYDWWLFLYKDPTTKKSHFTFLDLGIGVFESLSVKGILQKIKELTGFSQNIDFVTPLVNGEIRSRTGKAERGKGWPFIYETIKASEEIGNFILISNDVYANLSTGDVHSLDYQFQGTFIYWELNPKM